MDFVVDFMKEYSNISALVFALLAVFLAYKNIKEMILTDEENKEGVYFSSKFRSWMLVFIFLMFAFYLFFII